METACFFDPNRAIIQDRALWIQPRSGREGSACLLYGPYISLKPGKYSIVWNTKISENVLSANTGGSVLVLDVTSGDGVDVLARREFTMSNLLESQGILRMHFEVFNTAAERVEFRAFSIKSDCFMLDSQRRLYDISETEVFVDPGLLDLLGGPLKYTRFVSERSHKIEDVQIRGLHNVAGMTRPATVFLGDRVLTYTHLNQRIYVPSTDIDLAPHIFSGGVWEPHVLQTIARQVPQKSCALDVGANIGYHSLALARAVTHLGTVHAFEANPRLIPLLKSTFFVNGLNDLIRIHHLAVSDKPGVLELAQEPDHFGSGNIVPPGYEKIEAYNNSYSIRHQVIAKPLDSFLPDFGGSVQTIRMDIEGFEPQALYGAARLLEASPDIRIIAEWSVHMMAARTDLGAFVKWLEGQGFRFWLIEPNTANLVPLAGHETLGLPHSDVFISRKDPE
jgi:FkbM family methyltransferase